MASMELSVYNIYLWSCKYLKLQAWTSRHTPLGMGDAYSNLGHHS